MFTVMTLLKLWKNRTLFFFLSDNSKSNQSSVSISTKTVLSDNSKSNQSSVSISTKTVQHLVVSHRVVYVCRFTPVIRTTNQTMTVQPPMTALAAGCTQYSIPMFLDS